MEIHSTHFRIFKGLHLKLPKLLDYHVDDIYKSPTFSKELHIIPRIILLHTVMNKICCIKGDRNWLLFYIYIYNILYT